MQHKDRPQKQQTNTQTNQINKSIKNSKHKQTNKTINQQTNKPNKSIN